MDTETNAPPPPVAAPGKARVISAIIAAAIAGFRAYVTEPGPRNTWEEMPLSQVAWRAAGLLVLIIMTGLLIGSKL